jgi:polyphosphate kinase
VDVRTAVDAGAQAAIAEPGVDLADLTAAQRAEAGSVFEREISPVLTPLSLDAAHPFPFISNLSTSWAFRLRDPVTGESVVVRVKVPALARHGL